VTPVERCDLPIKDDDAGSCYSYAACGTRSRCGPARRMDLRLRSAGGLKFIFDHQA